MAVASVREGARLRLVAIAAAAAVGAALSVAGPLESAHADVVCASDECDNGAWKAARGEANELSYWGMSPGHNCTNYVAWRLITAGVTQPATHPGNAADWAFRAILDGYQVDRTPVVGAVAQWDADAGGNGPDGHVAYIEAVNDDGTILVSEDYWHGGDQLGPLTYRTVDPATISNVIHYGAATTGLREVLPTPTGWQVRGTVLNPEVTAMSAIQYDATGTHVYYAERGELRVASALNGQWSAAATGVPSSASALSAVAMRQRPFVMSLDDGVLYMNVATPSGWQRMSTGVQISGEIAAVDLGGLWPTVFVSQDGALYRVWGDNEGWHAERTGIELWGAIAAVVPEDGWPQVFSIEGETIFRAWQDADGWHEESTGATATGRLSASVVGGDPVLVFGHEGELQLVRPTDGQWITTPLGVVAGTVLATMDVGRDQPLIIQVG